MAVVINDFQVVSEAPPAPPRPESGAEAREASPGAQLDECALARLLRARHLNALRVWAH